MIRQSTSKDKVCYRYLMDHTFDFPYMAMGSLLEYKIQDGTYLKQLFGVGHWSLGRPASRSTAAYGLFLLMCYSLGPTCPTLVVEAFGYTNFRCFGLTNPTGHTLRNILVLLTRYYGVVWSLFSFDCEKVLRISRLWWLAVTLAGRLGIGIWMWWIWWIFTVEPLV